MSARSGRVLLGMGAAAGITLGAIGAFEAPSPTADPLPEGAAARVNGQLIDTATLAQALNETPSDNKQGGSGEQRQTMLTRLIEEELLVQHGLALGLAHSDRTVRDAIAAATIRTIRERSASQEPTRAQLEAFFEARYGTHNRFLFDQLGDQVVTAYRQAAAERAVRETLDWLWSEAEITVPRESD